MSHSYRVNYQHITFHVAQTLLAAPEITLLHEVITNDLRELGATNIAVGGVKDHVHIIANFKSLDISQCVWHCKLRTSRWLKARDRRYYGTFRWQTGYASFSVSYSMVPRIKRYIADQYRHHLRITSQEEHALLVEKNGGLDE